MPVLQTGLAKSGAEAYTIDQSLRFDDGDSAYLSSTPGSAGNRRTWTVSWWEKKAIPTNGYAYSQGASGNNIFIGPNDTEGRLWIREVTSGGGDVWGWKVDSYARDPGAWYHFVVAVDTTESDSADRVKVYINGVQQTLTAAGGSAPSLNLETELNNNTTRYIGTYKASSSYKDGYLAEFYLIDGTALTPASFGETDAATNQWKPIDASGLTFGTNGFYQKYSSTELAASFEDSANHTAHTVAANGDAHTDTTVKKFGTASAQFDGTGDYLSIPDSSDFDLTATADWTVEFWVYRTQTESASTALINRADDGGDGWNINWDGSDKVRIYNANDGSGGVATSTAITVDTWTQVAFVYTASDTTLKVYLDGALDNTNTSSPSAWTNVDTALWIGAQDLGSGATRGFTGYLDEIRVSKGVARYTADFTEPTEAFTSDQYTKLLLHCDGADDGTTFTDSADSGGGRHTITANGDVTNTRAESKVGDSSIKFDGTGDFLSAPDSTDWDFGTDPFTWEAWIRFNNSPQDGNMRGIIVNGSSSSAYNGLVYNGSTSGTERGFGWYQKAAGASELWNMWSLDQGDWSSDTWYHVAIVRDGDQFTLYVDGTSQVSETHTDALVDFSTNMNIGAYTSGLRYFDGYMDEIRISDTARYTTTFTPSTTEFTADSNTKLLIHSNWTGGLGADSSGNENDFTPTNLVATDQMVDSPTNNFCTLNPVAVSKYAITSMGEGNLYYAGGSTYTSSVGTIAPTSGKWYTEVYVNANTGTGSASWLGVTRLGYPGQAWWDTPYNRTGSVGLQGDGQGWKDGSTTTSDSSGVFTDGDVVGILMNLDDGEIKYKVNNSDFSYTTSITVDGVWTPCVQTSTTGNNVTFNFGQDSSFAGNLTAQGNQDSNSIGDFYYEPPTDFLALCTSNLPSPEIADPTKYFSATEYSGNAGEHVITTGVEPDLIWFKRTDATGNHALMDGVRGWDKVTIPNLPNAEGTETSLITIQSDGFTIPDSSYGGAFNDSGADYVTWNWKAGGTAASNTDGTITSSVSANTTAGFSIASYTGTGSAATVGHGLSSAAELIIVKNRDEDDAWQAGSSKGIDFTDYLVLNTDAGFVDNVDRWNDTVPSASVFTIGDGVEVNTNTEDYIAYCFHSIEGYSKVGSYEGNGDTDGPFIYTGFRPAYILLKTAASWDNGHWHIFDTKRYTYNETTNTTTTGITADNAANDGGGGGEGAGPIDILSNGFKIRNNNGNDNPDGDPVLYLAFAESPFKTSNAR